jgi:ribosome-associated protein
MKECGFMNNVKINTEYITLGQLLKHVNIASSGGMVKAILAEYKITVNDLLEARRGKKLYPGDKVSVKSIGVYRIVK